MPDDDDLAALYASSDDRIAAMILTVTGVPATPADIMRWRSALSRRLHRNRAAREGRPLPPPLPPIQVYQAARGLVGDFLASPEGGLLIATVMAAAAVPAEMIRAARATYALLAMAHGVPPSVLDRAHAYAVAKAAAGGAVAADLPLAARIDPRMRTAINAASPEHLARIVLHLAAARASARALGTPPDAAPALLALCEVGAEALAAYLDLDRPTVGPSLGVWPPPPPSLVPPLDVDAPPVQHGASPASRR